MTGGREPGARATGGHEPGPQKPAVRDPGLQPERTRLAWRRTTLTYTVVAVLALRVALHAGATAVGVVVCAVCAVLWSAFLWVAHRRIRTLAATARPSALAPPQAAAAALCAVATAVCAVALVVR
ncbi:DUF202 domain-containing protein [Streptomyces sp. NPDC002758]